MNALDRLKGRKVFALIENDEEETVRVEGTVIDVEVDDFYFLDKDEPIYIHVNIQPSGKLPEGVDPEDLRGVPLERLRRV